MSLITCRAPRICTPVLALTLASTLWGLPAFGRSAQQDPETVQMIQGLARGVAAALSSADVRARLAAELKASPYVEHRIALKRLLAQDETWRRDILEAVKIGRTWDEMSVRLPELELYFPAERHFETWKGAPGVRVSVNLGNGSFRSWAADGSSVTFKAGTVPNRPTLLLGPSEIDYDDAESARIGGVRTGGYLKMLATDARFFLRPETLLTPAAPMTKGVSTSNDSYLTYFRVNGEYDGGGQMEVSFSGTILGSYHQCQRFTGIVGFTDYYLAAPGAAGSRKIALAVPTSTDTVDITVYEDDDTLCTAVGGGDTYLGIANIQSSQFGTIYGTSNARSAVRVESGPHCGNAVCENSENKSNCCQDCGTTCGDGICGFGCGEESTCPCDCPTCGDGICCPGETCYEDCGLECPPCFLCPCN